MNARAADIAYLLSPMIMMMFIMMIIMTIMMIMMVLMVRIMMVMMMKNVGEEDEGSLGLLYTYCLAPCLALRSATKPHFANIYLTIHFAQNWGLAFLQGNLII